MEKDLIWVEKEFAEKYKALESDVTKNAERLKVFEEYLATITERTRSEYKTNLSVLEEDAAIYSGLMLNVKRAFEKSLNESLQAFYVMWENYDKDKSKLIKQIESAVSELKPLKENLDAINAQLKTVSTWELDNFVKSLERLNDLSGESKEMVNFLIANFKR